LSVSFAGDWDLTAVESAVTSLLKERPLLAKESPVVGIFRFFLLFVFSNDS
jgi:hypothetical protein